MKPGWEFIDHPADIQLHAWGPDMESTMEQLGKSFFEVMFESENFSDSVECKISVKGSDLQSLVYNYLDEWLFRFDTEDFVAHHISVTKVDLEALTIEAVGHGESFDIEKHNDFRRTEVKAITYASMKIDPTPGNCQAYVIVDL